MALIASISKEFITAHVEAVKAKQAAGLPTSGKPLPVVLIAPVQVTESEVPEVPETEGSAEESGAASAKAPSRRKAAKAPSKRKPAAEA